MAVGEWIQIAIVAVTFVLAVYACRQTRELSLSRNADVILKVFDIMDILRPKWHELYKLPDDHKNWSDPQKELADHVGVQLQRVAYLAVKGLVDVRLIKESWAGVFSQCWQKLENFIKDYRVQCGEERELNKGMFQQRMHFEQFALKCKG